MKGKGKKGKKGKNKGKWSSKDGEGEGGKDHFANTATDAPQPSSSTTHQIFFTMNADYNLLWENKSKEDLHVPHDPCVQSFMSVPEDEFSYLTGTLRVRARRAPAPSLCQGSTASRRSLRRPGLSGGLCVGRRDPALCVRVRRSVSGLWWGLAVLSRRSVSGPRRGPALSSSLCAGARRSMSPGALYRAPALFVLIGAAVLSRRSLCRDVCVGSGFDALCVGPGALCQSPAFFMFRPSVFCRGLCWSPVFLSQRFLCWRSVSGPASRPGALVSGPGALCLVAGALCQDSASASNALCARAGSPCVAPWLSVSGLDGLCPAPQPAPWSGPGSRGQAPAPTRVPPPGAVRLGAAACMSGPTRATDPRGMHGRGHPAQIRVPLIQSGSPVVSHFRRENHRPFLLGGPKRNLHMHEKTLRQYMHCENVRRIPMPSHHRHTGSKPMAGNKTSSSPQVHCSPQGRWAS